MLPVAAGDTVARALGMMMEYVEIDKDGMDFKSRSDSLLLCNCVR
jgi:hypothetical protein